MSTLAPGIAFETVHADRGDAGALRADVVGFAGVFMRGPVLVPRRVEDWGDATRLFGGFFQLRGRNRRQALGPLALYGFQQNGGATAVVVRLASPAMRAARATAVDPATGMMIGLAASSPGAWANGARVRVPLRVRGRAFVPAFPFVGGLAVGSIVRVRAADGAIAFGRLRAGASGLTLDPALANPGPYIVEELDPVVDVVVEAGSVRERFTALSLDPDSSDYVWSALAAPARVAPDWVPNIPAAWNPREADLVLALAQQGPGLSDVVRATPLAVAWASATTITPPWLPPSAETRASASSAELVATLTDGADLVRGIDVASFRAAIDALARHPTPSIVAVPDLMLPVVPDAGCERPLDTRTLPLPVPTPTSDCAPSPAAPSPVPANSDPRPPAEVIEDDDIPDLAASIGILQADLLASVVTGDTPAERLVLLDPLPGQSPASAIATSASFANEAPRPELGALLYPWLRILDPIAPANQTLLVPPSGHVAGIIARTTRLRGPSAPFANQGIVGVVAAELSLDVSARARLNAGQVSALREIAGHGVLVFGERTLAPTSFDPVLCYVPPSRVLAYVRRLLRVTGETLVFEPNDAFLSLRIVVTLDATLRELFLGGAFAGNTPAQSYRVRCDDVTTPPSERALGRIIALVDVALAVPLEFITIRIAFSRDGATVVDHVPTGAV
jgi:hypothetical protein